MNLTSRFGPGPVSASLEVATRSRVLPAYARLIALNNGSTAGAKAMAEHRGLSSVVALCEKAAAPAGSTEPGNWGAGLSGEFLEASNSFVASLRSSGFFDRAAQDAIPAPMRTRFNVV